MNNPAYAYRQFSVQGATPLGLVVMLYDGAIAAMQRAISAIKAHDIQKKCAEMNRALAIIAQLEGTLNFERGGKVARTLQSLYVYVRGQIMKGKIENSPEIVRCLIEKLASVREAWSKAEHGSSSVSSAGPSPSASEASSRAASPAPPPPSRRRSAYGDAWSEAGHWPPSSQTPVGEGSAGTPSPASTPGSWRLWG